MDYKHFHSAPKDGEIDQQVIITPCRIWTGKSESRVAESQNWKLVHPLAPFSLVYAQQGTEVPPKHHQHGLSRGIVEEATESFKNTEIDITSEQAKDIQARLFLSHLECESVLLYD